MKYKVIETNISYLNNVEAELDFSNKKTGETFDLFGMNLNITQLGGSVVGLSSSDYIMVLQYVPEERVEV